MAQCSKFSTTWAESDLDQQALQAQALTVGHLHGTTDNGHVEVVVAAEIAAKNGSLTGRNIDVRRTGEALSRLVVTGEAGPPQRVVLQDKRIDMIAESMDATVTGETVVQDPVITASCSVNIKCWTMVRLSS